MPTICTPTVVPIAQRKEVKPMVTIKSGHHQECINRYTRQAKKLWQARAMILVRAGSAVNIALARVAEEGKEVERVSDLRLLVAVEREVNLSK